MMVIYLLRNCPKNPWLSVSIFDNWPAMMQNSSDTLDKYDPQFQALCFGDTSFKCMVKPQVESITKRKVPKAVVKCRPNLVIPSTQGLYLDVKTSVGWFSLSDPVLRPVLCPILTQHIENRLFSFWVKIRLKIGFKVLTHVKNQLGEPESKKKNSRKERTRWVFT